MNLDAVHRGIFIPFTRMGNVTSEDLFEPREQEIFDFYERNQARYSRAMDVGANIGIHTVLMAKQRWQVLAFEPDPQHYEHLLANIKRNSVADRVVHYQFALDNKMGEVDFVRVLGNTTASHIAGSREFHGEVERFKVPTLDCRAYFDLVDFAKIDVEGHEAALLMTVTPEQAKRIDFMVEVGSLANAEAIFSHFHGWARMWSQKTGWKQVKALGDMPTHYTHGSLFIGEQWA
ncbi:MAG: FkbM family methyltransferase [Sulfuritalea sp.]|nr:FkbM family methyltransferase [Sulfuritalea sp.]